MLDRRESSKLLGLRTWRNKAIESATARRQTWRGEIMIPSPNWSRCGLRPNFDVKKINKIFDTSLSASTKTLRVSISGICNRSQGADRIKGDFGEPRIREETPPKHDAWNFHLSCERRSYEIDVSISWATVNRQIGMETETKGWSGGGNRRTGLHEGRPRAPNYCCQYLGQFNYLVITRLQTDKVAYMLRQATNAYMHVHKLHLWWHFAWSRRKANTPPSASSSINPPQSMARL